MDAGTPTNGFHRRMSAVTKGRQYGFFNGFHRCPYRCGKSDGWFPADLCVGDGGASRCPECGASMRTASRHKLSVDHRKRVM